MKAGWLQPVSMQYTHHAQNICLWHFWVGGECRGMSRQLGGPMCPTSPSVTCEATDASFCFSLYHLFSVVAWHSDFAFLPCGRRVMQSRGLAFPKTSGQHLSGSCCPDTQVFRVRNELFTLGRLPARIQSDLTEERLLFRISCLQFVVWARFVWQTQLFSSQVHFAPSSHCGTMLRRERNQIKSKLKRVQILSPPTLAWSWA